MSTIDMTQVAGIQAVNAEGNVIGTLSVDDLTELVASKIVQEAKNEAVSARSASVMSEASTLAATDEYEDKLDIDTNPAYIRSLDTNGNPKRTAIASLASVVGGLIGVVNSLKNGLMPKDGFIEREYTVTNSTPVKDIIDPGVYFISGSYSLDDIPSGWNSSLLLCYRARTVIIHLIINVSSVKMCLQTKLVSDNKWQNWNIED